MEETYKNSEIGSIRSPQLAALSGTACKKGVEADNKTFQSAKPELKKMWDAAMTAMKTNGYAAAIMQLQELKAQPGLSADQSQTVDRTATSVSDAMYAAANKDDPAGKKALEDLRSMQKR